MFKSAKSIALKLLSRRPYFEAELILKLREHDLSEAEIHEAIQECKRYGYLDDDERVRSIIRREMQKGKGPRYIEAKLKMLKIRSPLLYQIYSKEMEIEVIKKILLKKPSKDPIKLINYLQRRGFSLDIIRKIIL